jgi:hypothetical protein
VDSTLLFVVRYKEYAQRQLKCSKHWVVVSTVCPSTWLSLLTQAGHHKYTVHRVYLPDTIVRFCFRVGCCARYPHKLLSGRSTQTSINYFDDMKPSHHVSLAIDYITTIAQRRRTSSLRPRLAKISPSVNHTSWSAFVRTSAARSSQAPPSCPSAPRAGTSQRVTSRRERLAESGSSRMMTSASA